MITVRFTLRSGQGDAGGFDLGDLAVTGDFGTADSAGHVPDQGMMIYPASSHGLRRWSSPPPCCARQKT